MRSIEFYEVKFEHILKAFFITLRSLKTKPWTEKANNKSPFYLILCELQKAYKSLVKVSPLSISITHKNFKRVAIKEKLGQNVTR